MIWNYYINEMLFFLIINVYVSYGIPFDPKRYYKDGSHTSIAKAKIEEYTEEIRRSYEQRLETIWNRPVNRVHVLDFEGLTAEMRQDLAVRLRMVYSGEEQQAGSDRLIPDKGDLGDYWMEILSDKDFLGPAHSYVLIRDPVRRLCHRMITYSISGRGQAPEKVTGVDLFYLHSMDRRTTNVPHLLAQYLFRHAEGRKSEARLSGGHFIGRLAMHFGLLMRLHICMRYIDTWAWVAQGPKRQQAATAGALEADKAGQAAEEVALEIPAPAPAQAPPHLHPPYNHVLCHRGSRCLRRRYTTYGVMLWTCEEMSQALPPSSLESPPG
ncbi:hypothetical protein Tco_0734779 [Tanacetum coccineum]